MRTNRGDYLAWLEQHQTEIDEAISDYDVDYEYPKILDWAAAHRNLSLEWVETFVNAEGERSHHPEGGHWSLHWDRDISFFPVSVYAHLQGMHLLQENE